ncbi:hypothetical protein BC832DRAFT_81596 [Gaertneriomyces semiglobifer]|nr:hypothetical protein BC832DRAFT_81596 [Gaertneriomyces semiglobifer]
MHSLVLLGLYALRTILVTAQPSAPESLPAILCNSNDACTTFNPDATCQPDPLNKAQHHCVVSSADGSWSTAIYKKCGLLGGVAGSALTDNHCPLTPTAPFEAQGCPTNCFCASLTENNATTICARRIAVGGSCYVSGSNVTSYEKYFERDKLPPVNMTLHGVSLSLRQTFLENNPCEDPLHVGCDGVSGQCVQVKARSYADPILSDGCSLYTGWSPHGFYGENAPRGSGKYFEGILALWEGSNCPCGSYCGKDRSCGNAKPVHRKCFFNNQCVVGTRCSGCPGQCTDGETGMNCPLMIGLISGNIFLFIGIPVIWFCVARYRARQPIPEKRLA